ncbi:MAG: tetratricopeptide repeat protein [Chloroflexi bacterium]|nr:tetratricopeptide repeat protein [Chloroflexota bacterium]
MDEQKNTSQYTRVVICPYCDGRVSGESTVCPGCQEDLAALVHLEYLDVIRYNQALSLIREGRRDEAIEMLEASIKANPEFAPAHVQLAKLAARDGNWERARASVRLAVRNAPADPEIAALADAIIAAAPAIEPTATASTPAAIQEPEPVTASEFDALPPFIAQAMADEEADQVAQSADTVEPIATLSEPVPEPAPQEPTPEAPPLTVTSRSRLIVDRPPERPPVVRAPLPWLTRTERKAEEQAAVPAEEPAPDVPVQPELPMQEPVTPLWQEPAAAEPEVPFVNPVSASDPAPVRRTASVAVSQQTTIWPAIRKGILITVGLTMLIRALSGDE